jgi:putative SOS response-associated peptidase YedK
MCGRYVLYTTDKLQSRYQAKIVGDFLAPSYNITPGTQSPAIIHFSSTKVIYPMKWGLIPSWSRDGSIGNRLINARSETILSKPAFKSSIYSKRCLIPANGYFEWGFTIIKNSHFISTLPKIRLFHWLDIYDIWDSPDGSPIFSYTIITAPAQPKFSPFTIVCP